MTVTPSFSGRSIMLSFDDLRLTNAELCRFVDTFTIIRQKLRNVCNQYARVKSNRIINSWLSKNDER
jgi:hypothetical protein